MKPPALPTRHLVNGSRRGLTLIELLAALTILSAFTAAASAWLTSATRARAGIEEQFTRRLIVSRVADRIRSDLGAALPATVEADLAEGRLSMIAPDSIDPGGAAWKRVRWFVNAESRELIRETQTTDAARPERRIIAWGVERLDLNRIAAPGAARPERNWSALRIDLRIDGAETAILWERVR
ncbi:MAG: prepilin-type N-terminal cleavage/methylation domain-containing protein [Phycisphaeraceae bacterium]|nr:prepilin-type N-terminal cleavage/methylation domain-containing protein [Phycisphaeraceae bacterium]